MCANKNCPYELGFSIYETQRSAVDLLGVFELNRFGKEFDLENYLTQEDENRLVDAVFPFRHLCWECARSRIEDAMQWRFAWLDLGVWLTDHAELLKNIEVVRPISDEWIELLVLSSANKWISEFRTDDLKKAIHEFVNSGIEVEQVIDICSWYRHLFDESIEIEHLCNVIRAGYLNSQFLCTLDTDEIYGFINWGGLPPLRILAGLGGGLDEFLEMQSIFWDEFREDDDACDFIERLIHLNVDIGLLKVLSEELLEDAAMEAVVDELDDDLQDFRNRSFANQFLDSIVQVRGAGFELSRENIMQYWGLSSDLILQIVDNDLFSDEVFKMARVVENPEELASWLETGSELISHDLVRDWVKIGFSANEAHEWRQSGFDAETASRWRQVTDNPVAARRRIEAGIQPPEGAI